MTVKLSKVKIKNPELKYQVIVGLLLGDLNDDGFVNVLDMLWVAADFSLIGTPGWVPEDLNMDGVINEGDMVVIGQHWTG